jgi:Phage Tail Collar Domain
MPYTVNKSDPTQPSINVPDGTVNITDTSLSLIGRNYPNYGQALADNFVHLLENFSSPSAPNNPTMGQIWYDSSNVTLKLFDGIQWIPIPQLNSAAISSLPSSVSVSDSAVIPVSDGGVAYGITKSNFLSEIAALQTGMIVIWPIRTQSPPEGWLYCDGSLYYNYLYPSLSAYLGTTYGVSPTANYFYVPNLTGPTPNNGSTPVTYIIKT